jgi:hypothetical protein
MSAMMGDGATTSSNLSVRQNKITVLDNPNIQNIKCQLQTFQALVQKIKIFINLPEFHFADKHVLD